jgi:hypothetical protein
MAGALAAYSPLLRVYTYGARSHSDPIGVQRIVERLSRDSAIFDPNNEWISQCIIVAGYPVFHTRHGPSATKRYLKEAGRSEKQASKRKSKVVRMKADSNWRPPYEMDGLFGEICLDEAQNTKGKSTSLPPPSPDLGRRAGGCSARGERSACRPLHHRAHRILCAGTPLLELLTGKILGELSVAYDYNLDISIVLSIRAGTYTLQVFNDRL